MIWYGKGLQKELRKLALNIMKFTTKDSSIEKLIASFTEFYDDFNPRNNFNNSIILHNLSIIPIDRSVDSNEFTYSVAIGYKYKENMTIKTFCIKSFNEWWILIIKSIL